MTIQQLIDYVEATLIKKRHDYGNSIFEPLVFTSYDCTPDVAILVRLSDKVKRYENLTQEDDEPKYESLNDTLLDICGYCILYAMYQDLRQRGAVGRFDAVKICDKEFHVALRRVLKEIPLFWSVGDVALREALNLAVFYNDIPMLLAHAFHFALKNGLEG